MAGTRKRGTQASGGGRVHYATLVRELIHELQAYGYPRLMIWAETGPSRLASVDPVASGQATWGSAWTFGSDQQHGS